MKLTSGTRLRHALGSFLLCSLVALTGHSLPAADSFRPPPEYHAAEGEFLAISNAVLALLQSHDSGAFARELVASADDWKSVLSTNLPPTGDDPVQGFVKSASRQREQVSASARALLAKADALHVDFSKGNWRLEVLAPRHFGSTRYPTLQAEGESLPYAEKLELLLAPDGKPESETSTNDAFKLALHSLIKFPAGWRTVDGVQWVSFPCGVADARTLRELALSEKAMENKGFTGEEDPALLTLGETLLQFLRAGDPGLFEKGLLMNSDQIWAMLQKSGRSGGPTRQEVDEEIGKRNKEQVAYAEAVLRLLTNTPLDLKNAEVKIAETSVERAQSSGSAGSLDGMRAYQFKLTLSVKTDTKAKTGAALAGDYVLGIKRLVRQDDRWIIEDQVHWEKTPPGVLDDKTAAAMDFENYVAEHNTLPPKAAAPDIEFTTLVGDQKMKLADLRGKVVVLDFWATWCGPCQGPMADLQKICKQHPDWQDRVAIVPLSIDDTIDVVRKHVNQRGWTNTFNVWAGDGGWHAAPPTTFHVTGVPTTYIIDQQGKVVIAGHPASLPIEETVASLLTH